MTYGKVQGTVLDTLKCVSLTRARDKFYLDLPGEEYELTPAELIALGVELVVAGTRELH